MTITTRISPVLVMAMCLDLWLRIRRVFQSVLCIYIYILGRYGSDFVRQKLTGNGEHWAEVMAETFGSRGSKKRNYSVTKILPPGVML
ncbi:hypothetical protein L873DRAFT_1052988 [Choiromyces venosus 120613-1]|uniref:Uncharacterized protein n=1 Tax=Choiromyces venosus 120613-1 TaxID=1336337 RepID=A0A3N4JMW9_9PEZI|nr:hypothetical protein L873DRAFT_1052988 [Choiromyces venosus 120613-1]